MRRLKITHKAGGKVSVVDMDTKQVLDNVLSVNFKHEPGGSPVCIVQLVCKVEEYVLDVTLNESSK